MRQDELVPVIVETIPETLKEGLLYISKKHELSVHLCACGCGGKTVLPFRRMFEGKEKGWTHTENDGKWTTRPSIGNWSGENPYHAHYFITNNKIEWA